jgi:hypothetical protein
MQRGLLTLFGLVGTLAVLAAALVVWLVMQEPIMVADAVSTGQYTPLVAAITGALGHWCQVLAALL